MALGECWGEHAPHLAVLVRISLTANAAATEARAKYIIKSRFGRYRPLGSWVPVDHLPRLSGSKREFIR